MSDESPRSSRIPSRVPSRSPDPLDERLRAGLTPRRGVVERVVQGAIADPVARPGHPVLRWVPAAALALAVLLLVFVLPRGADAPADGARGIEAPPIRLSMTNVGDLIVVRGGPGGGYLLAASADGSDRSRTGQIMIVRGE